MTKYSLPLFLLFVLAVSILAMPRFLYINDPIVVRQATVKFLNTGSFEISEQEFADSHEPLNFNYVQNERNQKYFIRWSVLNSILYIPPLFVEKLITKDLRFVSSTDVYPEVLILNIYHLFFVVLFAYILVKVGDLFTPRRLTVYLFVLSCFFSTFLWNYLRAQATEIFQLIFFTLFCYWFFRWQRNKNASQIKNELLLSLLFFFLLCCLRVGYIISFPAIFLAVIWRASIEAKRCHRSLLIFLRENAKEYMIGPAIICLLGTSVILYGNYWQYGSPFVYGYSFDDKFDSNMLTAFTSFLVSPRYSLFFHFPLLLLAAVKGRSFLKKYFSEYIFVILLFLPYFFLICRYKYWDDIVSYGPRLLVVFLPLLALPALEFIDDIFTHWAKQSTKIAGGATLAVLGFGFYMQLCMNRMIFAADFQFTKFVQERIPHRPVLKQQILDYLQKENIALLHKDFYEFAEQGRSFYPIFLVDEVKRAGSPQDVEDMEIFERQIKEALLTQKNYYLFDR